MDIYAAPRITADRFGAILAAVKSPVLAERAAGDYYRLIASYGLDPAFLLAVAKLEHGYGTNPQSVVVRYGIRNWGDTRTRRKGTLGGRSIATDRGNFWAYPTWYDSLDDLCYRLTDPTYAYAGKRTVEDIVPIMAPPGDQDNDPTAYVRSVLATIAEWTKGAPPVTLSKPSVTSHPSPNHGYPGAAYKPEAIVWHISQGSGASAVNWLSSPAANASSNYVVMESGEIVELVNPENGADGAAWANGDVKKPDLANALIAGWVKAGVNCNLRTISIEHAGMTSNNHGGSLTPAQVAATIRLTAWLCARFGIAPDQDHILGHYQINDVDRHYCPGFSAAEWTAWVGQVAALVGGTGAAKKPIEPTKPPAPFQHAPGWLSPLVDTCDWTQGTPDAAGIVVARMVRVYNDESGATYQLEWDASTGFTPAQEIK